MTTLTQFTVTLEMSEQSQDTNHMQRMLFQVIDRQIENSEITSEADAAYVVRVDSVQATTTKPELTLWFNILNGDTEVIRTSRMKDNWIPLYALKKTL